MFSISHLTHPVLAVPVVEFSPRVLSVAAESVVVGPAEVTSPDSTVVRAVDISDGVVCSEDMVPSGLAGAVVTFCADVSAGLVAAVVSIAADPSSVALPCGVAVVVAP